MIPRPFDKLLQVLLVLIVTMLAIGLALVLRGIWE